MMQIAILGGGISGVGAALLAQKKGIEVFVSDAHAIPKLHREILLAHQIPFEEMGHTAAILERAVEVIKSPGIPYDDSIVCRLVQQGIPILDEVEFAWRYRKGKIVAITGSNGKTTTAHLLYHLLQADQRQVALVGNVGCSFSRSLSESDHAYYVLELSSFQMEGMRKFKPDIACLLNITPNHLDRYGGSFHAYAQAKFKLLSNMDPSGLLIYNHDDGCIHQHLSHINIPCGRYPFAITSSESAAIFMKQGYYYFHLKNGNHKIDATCSQLLGLHNHANIMAAMAMALLLDVSAQTIEGALANFTPLPHRIEFSGSPKGIPCYNDSKSTSVAATLAALRSFHRPVVWMAGGVDKGNDYEELLEIVKKQVKAMVCLGQDNKKIIEAFNGLSIPIYETTLMGEALSKALTFAEPDAIVLFSPACSSFDLFQNYQDRGNQFKAAVKELQAEKALYCNDLTIS